MTKELVPKLNLDQVIIAAPGPSLSKQQCELIEKSGIFTITIGDAGRVMLPHANVLYHCDKRWWDHYNGCPEFKGQYKFSLEQTDFPDIIKLPMAQRRDILCLKPPMISTGKHSGYQAVNLAVHFGIKNIILVGYDMKDTKDGRHNVIGHHPDGVRKPYNFKLFIANMATLLPQLTALGISIVNCTEDSDLNCFPRERLENVIGA